MSEGKQEARELLDEIISAYDEWVNADADFGSHRLDVAVDAAKAARQANQPQGKAQPEGCEWCDGLAIACADCLKRFEQRDFQRGQQAGLEKAAQRCVDVAKAILENADSYQFGPEHGAVLCGKAIRSLASAAPPQGEAEKEGRG